MVVEYSITKSMCALNKPVAFVFSSAPNAFDCG